MLLCRLTILALSTTLIVTMIINAAGSMAIHIVASALPGVPMIIVIKGVSLSLVGGTRIMISHNLTSANDLTTISFNASAMVARSTTAVSVAFHGADRLSLILEDVALFAPRLMLDGRSTAADTVGWVSTNTPHSRLRWVIV